MILVIICKKTYVRTIVICKKNYVRTIVICKKTYVRTIRNRVLRRRSRALADPPQWKLRANPLRWKMTYTPSRWKMSINFVVDPPVEIR